MEKIFLFHRRDELIKLMENVEMYLKFFGKNDSLSSQCEKLSKEYQDIINRIMENNK